MRKLRGLVLILLVSFFLITITINILAVGENRWRYSKEIYHNNREEVKAVYLDEEIYKFAKDDLSDLRLINDKNQFIPYYIYNRFLSGNKTEYTHYDGTEILSFKKNNNYYSDFQIVSNKENVDVVGNKLSFNVSRESFFKEIEILGSYDNKSWVNIKSDIIYKVQGVEKLSVSLEESYKYQYYRIVSINDATGVPIHNISLVYDENEATYEEHIGIKEIEYKLEANKEAKETNIKIHNNNKLKIKSIRIITKDDFNRSYKLYTANSGGTELKEIKRGEIYRLNLQQFKLENTIIQIGGSTGGFISAEALQIAIQDRDDYPINISGVEIIYYVDKLVFKSKDNDKLYILFGDDKATKPYYDISTYIEEMEKIRQEKTTLSELIERPFEGEESRNSFELKWILNISVLLISGILIIIILRKGYFNVK